MTDDLKDCPEANIPEGIVINEVQLLLAEKRTSLATLRTGIAVVVLPLSVLGLLIATSKYYDILNVLQLLIPLTILNLGLLALGAYLITRALRHIHRQDRHIKQLKEQHGALRRFLG